MEEVESVHEETDTAVNIESENVEEVEKVEEVEEDVGKMIILLL